ncbi:MAG: hypothetical protein AAFS12_00490 [Cyanobacteria bacterium J06632_19]
MKQSRRRKSKYTQLEISINGVSILRSAHQQQLLASARRLHPQSNSSREYKNRSATGEERK